MDGMQNAVKKAEDDILTIPLRNIILYLEKQFGRRFVLFVSQCEGDFSYLMKVPIGIEDEMKLRFAYRAARILVDTYGKETARSWFFGTNQALDDGAPASCLRHARSLKTLKDVLTAAESFCYSA